MLFQNIIVKEENDAIESAILGNCINLYNQNR